jgi:hypothetical protein
MRINHIVQEKNEFHSIEVNDSIEEMTDGSQMATACLTLRLADRTIFLQLDDIDASILAQDIEESIIGQQAIIAHRKKTIRN